MGCGSSSDSAQPASAPQPQQTQQQTVTAAIPIENQTQGGYSKGGGKGRKGQGFKKGSKFQVELSGRWQDYSREEDALLKKAWMVGNPKVQYNFRDQYYCYDFSKMEQINHLTGKGRPIREPYGFPKRPQTSLLPTGPMVVITIKRDQIGQCIQVPDPNNPGQQVPVYVPKDAKPGSKMAVPMPGKGEKVEQVQKKQKQYEDDAKKSGKWSTGAKVGATGAALVGVGAIGVGGVILGDHLAGGDMAGDLADTAVDVGEAIGDFGEDAIEALGDFGEDAIDWFGDAGEDVGDFIMDLF
jgi:hypothetical protein